MHHMHRVLGVPGKRARVARLGPSLALAADRAQGPVAAQRREAVTATEARPTPKGGAAPTLCVGAPKGSERDPPRNLTGPNPEPNCH